MSTALAVACSVFGCGQTSPCPFHSKRLTVHQDAEQVERHRFYRRAQWRRVRAAYLRQHPLCADCTKDRQLTPAIEVHHTVALVDGGAPYADSNLEGLCRRHHALRTLAERNTREGRGHVAS